MKIPSLLLLIIITITSINLKANNIDSLINVINSNQTSKIEIVDAFAEIAIYFVDTKFEPDSCKKYGTQGLSIARDIRYPQGIMKNLYALGKIESSLDNRLAADSIYELAYLTEKIDKQTSEFVNLLLSYAISKKSYGNYKLALELNFEALKIAEKIADSLSIAKLSNNIAIVYDITSDFEKSIIYYEKASTIFKRIGPLRYFANTLVNLVLLNDNLKQYDEVRKLFPDALKACTESTNHYALFNLYSIISRIERQDGNYLKALDYLNLANIELDSLSDDFQKNKLLRSLNYNLGLIQFEHGNFNDALIIFKKALLYASEGLYTPLKQEPYLYIANCFEELNKPDSALFYYKKYNEIEILILEEKNSKEIARIEFDYELQKNEKEQKLKELVLKSKIKNLRIIILSISILLILVLALIYLLIINRKRKIIQARLIEKNLSLKIENREKELTTNVLYLLKKNEFLANLTDTLQELNNRILPENKTYLRRIIKDIERNTFSDSWEEFEKRFQDVHVDFYKKLNAEFSNITPNELKLCAFLKLNMTSKDISAITNQSVDSLKVARYRLRKKLGLSREDNLITFLTKF